VNHHTSSITRGEAAAQLQMMLTNARDDRLSGFKADELARCYHVKAAVIETMLAAEQERRVEWARRHG
jgi:hypothetical protein